MTLQKARVILANARLRCGSCMRLVGALKFDAGGWPHLILTSPVCPRCGREQTIDYRSLEDATQARYRERIDRLNSQLRQMDRRQHPRQKGSQQQTPEHYQKPKKSSQRQPASDGEDADHLGEE